MELARFTPVLLLLCALCSHSEANRVCVRGDCFEIVNKEVTWKQSFVECTELDPKAVPAMISTEETLSDISDGFADLDNVWTGLRSFCARELFFGSRDTSYNTAAPSSASEMVEKDSLSNDKRCLMYNGATKMLRGAYCETTAKVLCHIPSTPAESAFNCHSSGCSVCENGNCYAISSEVEDMAGAEAVCKTSFRGSVPRLDTIESLNNIKGLLKAARGSGVISSKGVWAKITKEEARAASTKYWAPGEPTNFAREDCIAIRSLCYGFGFWDDRKCNQKFNVLCTFKESVVDDVIDPDLVNPVPPVVIKPPVCKRSFNTNTVNFIRAHTAHFDLWEPCDVSKFPECTQDTKPFNATMKRQNEQWFFVDSATLTFLPSETTLLARLDVIVAHDPFKRKRVVVNVLIDKVRSCELWTELYVLYTENGREIRYHYLRNLKEIEDFGIITNYIREFARNPLRFDPSSGLIPELPLTEKFTAPFTHDGAKLAVVRPVAEFFVRSLSTSLLPMDLDDFAETILALPLPTPPKLLVFTRDIEDSIRRASVSIQSVLTQVDPRSLDPAVRTCLETCRGQVSTKCSDSCGGGLTGNVCRIVCMAKEKAKCAQECTKSLESSLKNLTIPCCVPPPRVQCKPYYGRDDDHLDDRRGHNERLLNGEAEHGTPSCTIVRVGEILQRCCVQGRSVKLYKNLTRPLDPRALQTQLSDANVALRNEFKNLRNDIKAEVDKALALDGLDDLLEQSETGAEITDCISLTGQYLDGIEGSLLAIQVASGAGTQFLNIPRSALGVLDGIAEDLECTSDIFNVLSYIPGLNALGSAKSFVDRISREGIQPLRKQVKKFTEAMEQAYPEKEIKQFADKANELRLQVAKVARIIKEEIVPTLVAYGYKIFDKLFIAIKNSGVVAKVKGIVQKVQALVAKVANLFKEVENALRKLGSGGLIQRLVNQIGQTWARTIGAIKAPIKRELEREISLSNLLLPGVEVLGQACNLIPNGGVIGDSCATVCGLLDDFGKSIADIAKSSKKQLEKAKKFAQEKIKQGQKIVDGVARGAKKVGNAVKSVARSIRKCCKCCGRRLEVEDVFRLRSLKDSCCKAACNKAADSLKSAVANVFGGKMTVREILRKVAELTKLLSLDKIFDFFINKLNVQFPDLPFLSDIQRALEQLVDQAIRELYAQILDNFAGLIEDLGFPAEINQVVDVVTDENANDREVAFKLVHIATGVPEKFPGEECTQDADCLSNSCGNGKCCVTNEFENCDTCGTSGLCQCPPNTELKVNDAGAVGCFAS